MKPGGAGWQDFVASKEALKDIEANTLMIYSAGHGDMKGDIRRLYTEDSGGLQQAVDFNSLLAALSSFEMPFETVFAFVDACATRSVHKFKRLRFPEDDSDLKATQYAWFATSPGEEASFYADGGAFSAVLLEWLEGIRLPLDPKRVDKALSARSGAGTPAPATCEFVDKSRRQQMANGCGRADRLPVFLVVKERVGGAAASPAQYSSVKSEARNGV